MEQSVWVPGLAKGQLFSLVLNSSASKAIPGLEELSLPFLDEEINQVFKELPTDQAPRPDGFNGMFVKRCWPIIENDFLRLINDFYEGKLLLESINGSLITSSPRSFPPKGQMISGIYLSPTLV